MWPSYCIRLRISTRSPRISAKTSGRSEFRVSARKRRRPDVGRGRTRGEGGERTIGGLEKWKTTLRDTPHTSGKNGVLSPFYKSILISRSSKKEIDFCRTWDGGRSADVRRVRYLGPTELCVFFFLFSPNKEDLSPFSPRTHVRAYPCTVANGNNVVWRRKKEYK